MKKIFSTKFLVIFFTVLLAVQLVWDFYLYGSSNHTLPINYWFNIMYGSTSILIAIVGLLSVYLGHERKTTIARATAFLSWGSLANGLGLFYWAYNNLINNVEVPYPSLGEYLFLAFPILIGIGFWMLLTLFKPLIKMSLVLEALFVTTVSSAVIFWYFIIPNLEGVESFFGKFVTIAIPWEDAFIIALVYIALRLSGGKFRTYFWLFIISLILLVAGDFTFQYRNAIGVYWNGDIADLLYTLNMFVFALGVIYTIESSAQTEAVTSPVAPSITPPTPVATETVNS